MGYFAETVDVDFTIPADKVAPALEALKENFGEYPTLDAAVEEWMCIEDCEEDSVAGFALGCNTDKYLSRTDELLTALGQFANEGSYVRFRGEDGTLWGFRVIDGRLRDESGSYTWVVDPPRFPFPAGARHRLM